MFQLQSTLLCSAGPPISWADTAVLGAKVATEKIFVAAKISRAGNMTDGETISKAFSADWPVRQPRGAAMSASRQGLAGGGTQAQACARCRSAHNSRPVVRYNCSVCGCGWCKEASLVHERF